MQELDSISISTLATISDTFRYHKKAHVDYREGCNIIASGRIESRENEKSVYRHVLDDRSWSVCYVTTIIIVMFYLFLWYYFETGNCRFCSRNG